MKQWIGLVFILVVMFLDTNASFLSLFEYWDGICSRPEVNVVKQRRQNTFEHPPESRDWSLHSQTMKNFVRIGELADCKDVAAMELSLRRLSSDYSCHVPWLSDDEMCDVLQKYATVYFFGDSIVRQMAQTVFMLLSNDLRHGGFPRNDPQRLRYYCQCDGQFSEADNCRAAESFGFDDARDMQMCTHLPHFQPSRFEYERSGSFMEGTYELRKLCSEDPRPRFVYLGGGTHYDTSSYYTIRLFVNRVLDNIKKDMLACAHDLRVYILYTGVPMNSEYVAKNYPDQSAENTHAFNLQMEEYLWSNYSNVKTLNFWNLTKESLDRTSDGFHSLTDVNLIKTMSVWNAMRMMVEQAYPPSITVSRPT